MFGFWGTKTDRSLVQVVTPFVLSTDLQAQAAVYQHCLGFEMTFQADDDAFLRHAIGAQSVVLY